MIEDYHLLLGFILNNIVVGASSDEEAQEILSYIMFRVRSLLKILEN